MKKLLCTLTAALILPLAALYATPRTSPAQKGRLQVVTSLPDYAFLTESLGADRVNVKAIVRGDQDAHFIRPKPSFATGLRNADVLVTTGLDLELWIQTVIDNSGNRKIRSGLGLCFSRLGDKTSREAESPVKDRGRGAHPW